MDSQTAVQTSCVNGNISQNSVPQPNSNYKLYTSVLEALASTNQYLQQNFCVNIIDLFLMCNRLCWGNKLAHALFNRTLHYAELKKSLVSFEQIRRRPLLTEAPCREKHIKSDGCYGGVTWR